MDLNLVRFLKSPYSVAKQHLKGLKKGGILASHKVGRTRIYEFNPRYPLLMELIQFLEKAYKFLPEEYHLKYYEPLVRKRPRRKGKPL